MLVKTFAFGFSLMTAATLGRLGIDRETALDWVLLAAVMLGAFVASFGAGLLAKTARVKSNE